MQSILASYTALISALLIVWMGTRYCVKFLHGKTDPRSSTWIIFELGTVMSLVTYFSSREHSVVSSITNVADGVMVTAILAVLLTKRWGEKVPFRKSEKWCLKIAVVALMLWALTRTSWVGVAGFQVVMIVAYFPTLENLWHWEKGDPPEPAETWSINAFAALLGIGIAIAGNDYVAILYPLRGFVFCTVVLVLIQRWKRKNSFYHTNIRA